MATDEPFSGPVSESVPSSVTGFAYQRPRQRQGSISSFTYFQEQEETPEYSDEEAVVDVSDEEDGHILGEDRDLEAGDDSSLRRKSSSRYRTSSDRPLLRRHESARSDTQEHDHGGNFSQKLYIETEDLTMVIAGFFTSPVGYLIYVAICVLTAGIGYLVFRWIPRWRISLVGTPAALQKCSWVVVENQWGEFTVHHVSVEEYGHPMSTVFTRSGKEKLNGYRYDEDQELPFLRYLDYRYMRLLYHPIEDKFVLNNDWWDPQWTEVKALRRGLDSEERDPRDQVFGKNMIEIQQKTIPELLLDEAFHPFYIFQIASLILWSMDEYYYYAAAIFLISVFSITTTVIETRSTMRRLREISRFECDVRVLRNGFWRSALSGDLVPGDVYEVSDPSLSQLPCDSLLLAGDCIINESMLTGESIPVSKVPITDEALRYVDLGATSIHPSVARHFLFCGTKIIRARRPQDVDDDEAVALAMVVRTGFNTTKGALVRSMLFPKPSGFKFYRDSFRYISVMGVIAAVGFIASFINFVKLGLAWHLIIVRALDLITIVVPPALPATLTIGTNFALSRLRKQQIFCISPQRVNVAGKLDVICFDKTGTLTEDGLDVLGVRLVQHPEIRFGDILEEAHELLPPSPYDRDPTVDYRVNKTMLYTMATCHSLRSVDDELIGDPLDLKMFQYTDWSFEEGSRHTSHFIEHGTNQTAPSVARPPPGLEYDLEDSQGNSNPIRVEMGVLRSFEFVSHLRRASVIVRQQGDPGASIYVKGAPEVMKDICISSSIPDDFEDLLSYYTHKGFRVIACASKYISRLSWDEIENMDRSEAESRLQLIGFIIFENKLKAITTEIIEELNGARIRNVMCTGDNILTAISVARECGIIDRNEHCFVPHFAEGDKMNAKARLTWESVDNPIYQLDENTLLPLPLLPEDDTAAPYDAIAMGDYTLAVTGDAFRWIIDFGSTEVLQRMLVKGTVFARMSPDEKHELVEKMQSIDYCCGFCGDGANDCGALKAADVGVSLSEAEASVAAPFTSHVFDISCVPTLIKEGRAALVTSFCCFKYMSLYSAIQFTSVSFLYASASNLGDFQFLFIDLALILPIAIFMGWTGAYPVLSKKHPTANLVSRKVLTPLLGQIVLSILVQLIAFETVQDQPWYQPPQLDKDKSNVDNSQNTALFLVSCYQYTLSGVVLSSGPPFRQSMTTNAPFCVTIVVALLISLYMLLDPAKWLADFMDLTEMSLDYELFLLALAATGFAVAYLSEQYAFPSLAKFIGRLKLRLRPDRPKKRKRGLQLGRSSYHIIYLTWAKLEHPPMDPTEYLIDNGWLPSSVIRIGIRRQLAQRVRLIKSESLTKAYERKMSYISALRGRPIAIDTDKANEQHYEVGTSVLRAYLGPRMKYSSCLYPTGRETLAQAEVAMLESYVRKADLRDGQYILDLGCGWGSACLYLAELFPGSKVTAFSNSRTQRAYIEGQAKLKGLTNLTVITGDVVTYEFAGDSFDRVVSIELFEHMKNYKSLMAKIARALRPGGKLFVHIFAHKESPYDFEEGWMSTHFFTGGTMLSADLLHFFQDDLTLREQWWVSGKHYAKTCEDWLTMINGNKKEIWPGLEETYGKDKAAMWYYRWQVFYMACAELFAFEGGDTWGVCHYLFEKDQSSK
ncbi:uncharacterized protein Z518_01452 [Rhinocladiella mackenziei CBS 650.93]|uniref:Cation-transporting ATPase n=1 Tax=Rhinocladiella mackenziei CBS 650.93 TaxID=1442369 RepID=A0A0D2JLM6_9EURO|nr:uncharacterized protein Z518_01452 [Rhinocladiella mackenziei CBS 650.93]KIX10370.1 hypothetical protein Z518_01452 [Rhinocladiella mackenziei CBS 650.93]